MDPDVIFYKPKFRTNQFIGRTVGHIHLINPEFPFAKSLM